MSLTIVCSNTSFYPISGHVDTLFLAVHQSSGQSTCCWSVSEDNLPAWRTDKNIECLLISESCRIGIAGLLLSCWWPPGIVAEFYPLSSAYYLASYHFSLVFLQNRVSTSWIYRAGIIKLIKQHLKCLKRDQLTTAILIFMLWGISLTVTLVSWLCLQFLYPPLVGMFLFNYQAGIIHSSF